MHRKFEDVLCLANLIETVNARAGIYGNPIVGQDPPDRPDI